MQEREGGVGELSEVFVGGGTWTESECGGRAADGLAEALEPEVERESELEAIEQRQIAPLEQEPGADAVLGWEVLFACMGTSGGVAE
jgi:hypothetical protein